MRYPVDDLSESEEKKEPVDDMLNTPLILQGTIHILCFFVKTKKNISFATLYFDVIFCFHAVV